jgi:hypothetical protein
MASSSSKQPSHRSVFDAGYIRTEFEAAGVSPHFIPLIWKYASEPPGTLLARRRTPSPPLVVSL